MFRKTYVEVNLNSIRNNVRFFKNNSGKRIIGVIKANGYGVIDYMEAKVLIDEGVDFIAVSSLDEALRLRNHDIDVKILVLGYVPLECMDLVRKNNISVITLSKDYVLEADLKDVNVQMKINTGMNRIGILPEESKEVLEILKNKGAKIEGIMSHFSSSDSDIEYSKKQYELFKDCVRSLQYDFSYIHMNATDSSIILSDDFCTHHRIGLGLLGFSSYDTALNPSIRVFSEVTMVKKLNKGDTVSYGRHYTSDGSGYILTLPIGYADGFYRSNTGKKVYINGEYGTIAGSVCMDQMMIHTKNRYEPGTLVEIFGEHVSIEERAKELGTITYELLTSLSDRISRIYVEDGKIVKTIDQRL